MKQRLWFEPRLKEFHWEGLANVHIDLNYQRHRFIQAVNENLSTQISPDVEALDQLARVDDLLKAASDKLEQAKAILFDFCYEGEASHAQKTE